LDEDPQNSDKQLSTQHDVVFTQRTQAIADLELTRANCEWGQKFPKMKKY